MIKLDKTLTLIKGTKRFHISLQEMRPLPVEYTLMLMVVVHRITFLKTLCENKNLVDR